MFLRRHRIHVIADKITEHGADDPVKRGKLHIDADPDHKKETKQRKKIRRNNDQPVALAFKPHRTAGIVFLDPDMFHLVKSQHRKKAVRQFVGNNLH